ncbi:hypothetical protein [Paenibacillus sp. Root444D2]|uniref:hypothetical protein n=1 Tax=Paenibacillus sp. Root444D2 TaxID=1736538 RepID=UPI00070E09D5|nr:hypothetical protein [Paenibacillus sp. Root444D2]KQX69256.1 hypothetical protein ASD40_01780 [Paenibacillus sp. Root444D2]
MVNIIEWTQILRASKEVTDKILSPMEYNHKERIEQERRRNLSVEDRYREDMGRVYRSMR